MGKRKSVMETAIGDLAASVARTVLAPDYYEGPWRINALGMFKVCRNYATANAWAKYFNRNSIWNVSLQKVI